MRITELLESLNFKEEEFTTETGELDFDLIEDLDYFMHHDDDTYRRHVYPSIIKCLSEIKKKKSPNPLIFKSAALESYKTYSNRFPIRQLPKSLNENQLDELCQKLYKDTYEHAKAGKYK